jgi:hypothetical protein
MEKKPEINWLPVKSTLPIDVEAIKEEFNEFLTEGTGTVTLKNSLERVQKFFDMEVKSAIIFKQGPGREQQLHVDGHNVKRMGSASWALNIPLEGYENSRMEWWTGPYRLVEAEGRTRENKELYPKYLKIIWDGPPVLADTLRMDRPTIVRVAIPHRVINESKTVTRKLLTVRFKTDTSLLQWADI